MFQFSTGIESSRGANKDVFEQLSKICMDLYIFSNVFLSFKNQMEFGLDFLRGVRSFFNKGGQAFFSADLFKRHLAVEGVNQMISEQLLKSSIDWCFVNSF